MEKVSRKRSRPQVVEVTFVEPGRRGGAKRASPSRSSTRKEDTEPEPDPTLGLRRHEIFQEVMDLGSTRLDKKQQRKLKEAKLVKLGCKPMKRPKEPYNIILRRKKVLAERERKKKYFQDKHGLKLTQPSSTRKLTGKTKQSKSDGLLEARDRNFGRFKNGVLTLRKDNKRSRRYG